MANTQTIATPTGNQTAAQINAARAAAVASGGNPYAGSGATNLSNSAGLNPPTPKSGNSIIPPGGGATGAPVTSVTNPTPTNGSSTAVNSGVGTDQGFNTAESDVTPMSEDQIYAYWSGKNSAAISAAQETESAAEQAANTESTQATSSMNFGANAAGLAGSSEANSQSQDINTQRDQAITQAQATRDTALAGIAQNINSLTQADFQNEQNTVAPNYIANRQSQATSVLKGMSQQGISLTDLQTSNPNEYNSLLQYFNGDPNAMAAAYALNVPTQNIAQSWTNGSTYYQLSTNPITGAPTVHSFDLGITPPPNWTQTKVGTSTIVMTDPSNSMNTITYTTNPFTGQLSVTGSGTGKSVADSYTQNNSSGNSTSDTSTNSTQSSTASTTVSNILGVDPMTSLSSVISSVGIPAITNAIIKNEGGSPAGVVNNPGNIKFNNLPGQVDSGVKAADGGTFASYSSPSAGLAAVGNIINEAAQGSSGAYGQNPTLQSFVNTWTNSIDPTASTVNPTTGLDTKEYGLLANVSGFDPSPDGKNSSQPAGVDTAAWNYLNQFLTQGKTPTAASVGISTRSGSGAEFNTIAQRADQVYFQATGQHLPNATTLASNLGLISNNNTLLNNLDVQTGVITKNFGLNLENLTDNNVNQGPPVINKIVDYLSQAAGDTSVAQYLSQNATLQQEIGSLLSIKNASGVTVADKIAAGDLLPTDLSADQQRTILSTLMKEATNQQRSIGQANMTLYQETDPLGIDPKNPINLPGYAEATSLGFTPNGDGTYTSPDGSETVDGSGNTIQ